MTRLSPTPRSLISDGQAAPSTVSSSRSEKAGPAKSAAPNLASWSWAFFMRRPTTCSITPMPYLDSPIEPGSKQSAGCIETFASVSYGDELEDAASATMRTSVLRGHRLPAILISQSFERGYNGKCRLGVDAFGHEFAVKEMRTKEWRRTTGFTFGGPRAPKTAAMARSDIVREVQLAARLNGALPFLDVIDIDEKIYAVMPYYNGSDVFSLTVALSSELRGRRAGATSVVAHVGQAVAHNLAQFHAQHVVHNDVRVENMLWDKDGRVILADLGRAIDTAQGHIQRPAVSHQLSHVAPEYFDSQGTLSDKLDVWSLGVSLLNLFLGSGAQVINPFMVAKDLADKALPLYVAQRQIVADWCAFQAAYDKSGTIEPDLDCDEEGVYAEFEALIGRLEKEDKGLCDFIVRRMLVPDPKRRADASETQEFFKAHLTPSRRAQAKSLMRRTYDKAAFLQDHKATLKALHRKAKHAL